MTIGQNGLALTHKVDASPFLKTSGSQQPPRSLWNDISAEFTSATTFHPYHQDVGVAKALEPIRLQLVKDASHFRVCQVSNCLKY